MTGRRLSFFQGLELKGFFMRRLLKFGHVCALSMVALLGCGDTIAADDGGGVAGHGGAIAADGGGGAAGYGDAGGSTPPIIDAPGDCFEIFGPAGMGHSAPRVHDLGLVRIGDSADISVRFYTFCDDTESVVVETIILSDLSPSDDFTITRAPAPGETLMMEGELFVDVTLSPTVAGWHRARIRLRVSHGYYDFDIVAEAVELGGVPAPFEANCLEVGPSETFAGGAVGQEMMRQLDISADCEASWGSTHVVLESHSFTGNEHGAFALREGEEGNALVWGPSEYCGPGCAEHPRVIAAFTPPSYGEFEAVLTLITNEPNGEHQITLHGSTENESK